MVKQLQDLLHECVDEPARETLRVDELLRAGRRRMRRRRGVLVLAGAATTVAVVAAGSTLLGSAVGPGRTGPAHTPAPAGEVVHLDEAQSAVEGTDFTVLTTVTNENLDRSNGRYLTAVTPDRSVLVKDGPHGLDNTIRWGLLDPSDEEPSWLPEPDQDTRPVRVVDAGQRWLVWSDDINMRQVGFSLFDRETQTWKHIGFDATDLGSPRKNAAVMIGQAGLGSNGRVYFSVMSMAGSMERFPLWSASLADGTLRREGTVGDFDITGDQLVYTKVTNKPTSTVYVRDLTTGEETSFNTDAGARCNQLSLRATGERIMLTEYCGTRHHVRDDRVHVVTIDGEQVVTVQGNGLGVGALTSRFLTVQGLYDDDAGSYAYDFETRDWLRLADGAGKFGTGMVGYDDLLTWSTPVNGRHGMKYWVAEVG